MHLWNLPTCVPILLGYYRLLEEISLTFDFMVFEIVMCGILYLLTKGILFMKVAKLEKANEEANNFFSHLSQEPNSTFHTKCLRRCLDMSDAALNAYDSLLMYFGNLQHEPSRRVCLQRWPDDLQLMRKISTEESFQCLKSAVSNRLVLQLYSIVLHAWGIRSHVELYEVFKYKEYILIETLPYDEVMNPIKGKEMDQPNGCSHLPPITKTKGRRIFVYLKRTLKLVRCNYLASDIHKVAATMEEKKKIKNSAKAGLVMMDDVPDYRRLNQRRLGIVHLEYRN